MVFWLFMFVMVLVIPLAMILFGYRFLNAPPKNINFIYGYRTRRSIKSKEAWDFAHKYFGKICFILGLILFALTFIPFLFLIKEEIDTISKWGMVALLIQVIVLFIPIIPTERALRKNFDEHGNRKY